MKDEKKMTNDTYAVCREMTAKEDLQYKITSFERIINPLRDSNLVLGGKWALRLHGIKMSIYPKDIDIILYKPTTKQLEYLELIRPFDITKRPLSKQEEDEYPVNKLKVMKFKKVDYFLDVIQYQLDMPNDLLSIVLHGYEYQVQSVKNVIEAKASYIWEQQKIDGLHSYVRSKDLLDLIDFKNNNFNL